MKWIVIFFQGEGAIADYGVEPFELEETARAFIKHLIDERFKDDKSLTWRLIEGRTVDESK